MQVIETKRLHLHCLRDEDAELILDLLSQPLWLEFIGDRGVRNQKAAPAYIKTGPLTMIKQ